MDKNIELAELAKIHKNIVEGLELTYQAWWSLNAIKIVH